MQGAGTLWRSGVKVATVTYSLLQIGTMSASPYVGILTVTKGDELRVGETVTLVLADGSKLNVTLHSPAEPSSSVFVFGGKLYGAISTGPLSLPEDDTGQHSSTVAS